MLALVRRAAASHQSGLVDLMRAVSSRCMAIAFIALAGAVQAEERAIGLGDLLLVRARLRDCPDRSRLVEVLRLEDKSIRILDLGSFSVAGKTPSELLREVKARYRKHVPGREVPPIVIEVDPHADVSREGFLLRESLHELDCEGFMPDSMKRRYEPANPLFERIAAR